MHVVGEAVRWQCVDDRERLVEHEHSRSVDEENVSGVGHGVCEKSRESI